MIFLGSCSAPVKKKSVRKIASVKSKDLSFQLVSSYSLEPFVHKNNVSSIGVDSLEEKIMVGTKSGELLILDSKDLEEENDNKLNFKTYALQKKTKALKFKMKIFRSPITKLVVSRKGRYIVCYTEKEEKIIVLEKENGYYKLRKFPLDKISPHLIYVDDQEKYLALAKHYEIFLYNLSHMKLVEKISEESKIENVIISSHDNMMAYSSNNLVKVRSIDMESKRVRVLKGHKGPIMGVRFFNKHKKIITTSMDKTVKIWDLKESSIKAFIFGFLLNVKHETFHIKDHIDSIHLSANSHYLILHSKKSGHIYSMALRSPHKKFMMVRKGESMGPYYLSTSLHKNKFLSLFDNRNVLIYELK